VARKATGGLAVRDLHSLVKQDQVIDTENLQTIFVIVSKHSMHEWQASYEKLTDFVVSRSLSCTAPTSMQNNDVCSSSKYVEQIDMMPCCLCLIAEFTPAHIVLR
jgi:V-ATPase subunit C